MRYSAPLFLVVLAMVALVVFFLIPPPTASPPMVSEKVMIETPISVAGNPLDIISFDYMPAANCALFENLSLTQLAGPSSINPFELASMTNNPLTMMIEVMPSLGVPANTVENLYMASHAQNKTHYSICSAIAAPESLGEISALENQSANFLEYYYLNAYITGAPVANGIYGNSQRSAVLKCPLVSPTPIICA